MSLLLYRRSFCFQMLTSKILLTFEWYQPFRIMSVRVWVGLEQGRITLLWESVYFTLCKQNTPTYQYLFAFFRLRPEIGQAHVKTCACPTSGLRRKAQIKVVLKLTRSHTYRCTNVIIITEMKYKTMCNKYCTVVCFQRK